MNSRFRPYCKFPQLSITNSVTRQGGSINIIQVTVYSFTVPALKLMKVEFCLFLATTAHCHYRAAIKIHITTFNRIYLHVRCGNLHNFNCFWLSIYLYILIRRIIYSKILDFLKVSSTAAKINIYLRYHQLNSYHCWVFLRWISYFPSILV